MTTKTFDRILFGMALTMALGSALGFGWSYTRPRRAIQAERGRTSLVVADEPDDAAEDFLTVAKAWDEPSAQSRGPEWRYELFTPPEVRYDATTRQLAVTRPDNPASGREVAPGLELVDVARNPFRLQLLGYIAGAGKLRGAFENRLTGEVFLAGSGGSVPELDLEIVDFAVRRGAMPLGESGAAMPWIAAATVRDRRTGRITTLTAGEDCFTGELSAVLTAEDDEGSLRGRFGCGDEIETASRTYRIDRLQFAPPEVELVDTLRNAPHTLRLKMPASLTAESVEDAEQFPP